MIAAEAGPWAQTGGLADVLRALPPALARRGHRVRVFLPAYGRIARDGFEAAPAEDHQAIPLGIGRVPARFPTRPIAPGVRLTLVLNEELFGRDGLYGPQGGDYPDNARRFAFLARAVVELARRAPRAPDVLHGHDWHAGLAPLFARRLTAWPSGRPALVHTIHNMGYQGPFGAEEMDWIALGGPLRDALFRYDDGIEFEGGINFLKAALAESDRLTAVSPRYAWEITTREGGFGLHDLARRRGRDLIGILNGADYDRWDPSRDRHLPRPYGPATLEVQSESRRALRAAFGLGPDRGGPIFGVVSRLVHQKGMDLLLGAAPAILRAGGDLVVLGAGDGAIVAGLERLLRDHPGRVGIFIGFDEPRSHLVVAGSDLMLIPSRYEPCGLVQMHAMRYGTIPIVHRTGGLADTVRDEDEHPGRGTGFVFDSLDPDGLAHAAHRAMVHRARDPRVWEALRRRAMAEDFSWDRAAGEYEGLYRGLRPH